jgi:hypothetical protein
VVAEAPEMREIVALLSVAAGPVGETDVVRAMLPLKPLTLVKVTVDVGHEPAGVVRLEGLALMEKSGDGVLLLKVADWTVSGTGIGVPLATVTHTPPLTLVFVQPVWNPIVIPGVVPVTLYMAVKRRPIVGVAVIPEPRAEVATS